MFLVLSRSYAVTAHLTLPDANGWRPPPVVLVSEATSTNTPVVSAPIVVDGVESFDPFLLYYRSVVCGIPKTSLLNYRQEYQTNRRYLYHSSPTHF